MSTPFLAEIRIFAGDFAPTGWAQCNGQLLPLSQNTALFALLGTLYGGDGKSTFALPNLQGSVAIAPEQGPGLSNHTLGEQPGSQFVTLIESEMPAHNHAARGSSEDDDSTQPGGNSYGQLSVAYAPAANLQPMAFQTLSPAGSSLPHNNMMPYLTLTYIIALQGVFPPRP